jgi:prophage DNA circulation protein
MADEIFKLYQSASFSVDGVKITFPAGRLQTTHQNRIVQHERVYRKGARLDNTGPKAKVWRFDVGAYNSDDHEPDVNGADFYPTELNKLLAMFDSEETGDLVVPGQGTKRAKADSYDRVEDNGERDSAGVVLTFIEDNEDDADASSFTAPTAASVVKKKAEDAVLEAEDLALSEGFIESMNQLSSDLDGTLSAPGAALSDIESTGDAIQSNITKIEESFYDNTAEVGDEVAKLMTDPASSRLGLILRQQSDIAARAVADVQSFPVTLHEEVFQTDLSMFDLASATGMSLEDVLKANPLLNPFFIPAGTPVNVL